MKKLTTKKMWIMVLAIATSLFTLNSCEDDEGTDTTSEVIQDIIVKINAGKGFAFEGEAVNYGLEADSLASLISSYSWTFEGGSPATSTEAAPSVTYTTAGTYEATLTVVRTSDSEEFSGKFSTVVLEKAETSFMADLTSVEEGGQVIFRSTSSSNDNLSWTFEGGTPETSTDAEVTVTYLTPGTFDVTLTSALNGSSTTETLTDYIDVGGLAEPTFTASATTIDQRESITYTNTTATTDATINWSFTGGDISSSTEEQVTVTYPDPGTFDVTLEITKNGVTKTLSETEFITVNDIPEDAFLVSAETNIEGSIITISYDQALNDPAAETITVAVDGVDAPVTSVELDTEDNTSILVTLTSPITNDEAVITATYETPGITTVDGGSVEAFTDTVVTNNYVSPDALFVSAETSIDGTQIIVTYDQPLNDPSMETITVSVDNTDSPVSDIALDVDDSTNIILTLTTPISSDASIITVTYAMPTITTTAGGVVPAITDESVLNNFVDNFDPSLFVGTDPTFEDGTFWGPFPVPDGLVVEAVTPAGNGSNFAIGITTPTDTGSATRFELFSPANSIVLDGPSSKISVEFDYNIPAEWTGAEMNFRITGSGVGFNDLRRFIGPNDLIRDGQWHTFSIPALGAGGDGFEAPADFSGRVQFQIITAGGIAPLEIRLDNFKVERAE